MNMTNPDSSSSPGPLGKFKELAASDRRVILVAAAVALAARLVAVLAVHNFDTVTGFENEEIAINLLSGFGYSMSFHGEPMPTAFMYPLYTFFLAGHFHVFGIDWMPVEISQAVAGVLGVPLIFYLGFSFFNRMTGVAASFAYALYPVYVYWVTQGQSLAIDVVLLMLVTLCWRRGIARESFRHAAAAGLALGLAGLSKTLYLVFFPSFLIWTYLAGYLNLAKTLRFGLAVGVFALIVIAPWTARNIKTLDALVIVTDNSGFNLWLGNNPNATGGLYTEDGRHIAAAMPNELRVAAAAAETSPRRDRIFKYEALDWILENPGGFVDLVPKRLRALWFFDPYMPASHETMRTAVYLALMVPALVGVALASRRFREHALFYLFYLTMTFVYSFYFGQARFRYAIDWTFILFASYAFARVLRRLGADPELD